MVAVQVSPARAGDAGGNLEGVQSEPGVAANPLRQQLDRCVVDRRLPVQPPHRLVCSPAQDRCDRLRRQLLGAKQRAPAHERRIDFEERVLGRGTHQRDDPVLDPGQQRILLRLGEAMDFIEEQHGSPAVVLEPACRHRQDLAHVLHSRRRRRELLESSVTGRGHEAGQRRLARTGRTPQDHGHGVTRIDNGSERGTRRRQVLLSNHLVEGAGTHPRRQGCGRRTLSGPVRCEEIILR